MPTLDNAPCPDPKVVAQFLLGRIEDQQAQALEEHLLHCPCCSAHARTSTESDTLVEAVRNYRPRLAKKDDPVPRIIERLCAAPSTSDAVNVVSLQPEESPSGEGKPLFARVANVLRAAEDAPPEVDPQWHDFLAPPEQDDEIGRLGPYRVLQVIGAGGMGVVFLADDPNLERKVALKAMHPALAASESARQRFLHEARAAARVQHDHIVTVHQVGTDRGIPYLAMTLLRGQSLLDRLIPGAPLPLAESLRIGRELAEGLAAAHRAGLVHRDIKPANIWLEEGTGRVKILDFGLARAADCPTDLTRAGTMLGTPGFASPEQIQGEDVDARADLFSLGCTLYLMTTGEPPFTGLDPMALRAAVVHENPQAPQTLSNETPEAFSDLIMELLEKSPAARPQSAEEAAERIRRIETGLESGVPSKTVRVPAAPSKRKPNTPRRWTYALAAAGALLLISAGFYAGPGVYRIATNQGLLIIEAPDDDVQVEVTQRGEVVKIIDTATDASVTLKAGQYTLSLKNGTLGLRLESDQITLYRGDREIVHARLERTASSASPPQVAPIKSAESEPPPLAEWLAGRPVITVASRGGGDYYSIDAALEAAQPGEVVKVLDAGPHPARLNVGTRAAGLVSDAGAQIELEQWISRRSDVRSQTPSEESGSREWLWGGRLTCPEGFRLSGVEIMPPPPPSNPSFRFALAIDAAGDVVIESCRLLGEPNNKLPPEDKDRSRADFRAIDVNMALDPSGQRKEVIVRECHLEGVAVLGDAQRVLIRRNWLLRFGRNAITLPNEACEIIVSHNVVTATHGIWLPPREPAPKEGPAAGNCLIANNHLVTEAGAITVPGARWHSRRPGTLPLHRVRVVNNLIWPPEGISAEEAGDMPSMRNAWNVGHNAYLQPPAPIASGSSSYFPRQATDLIVQNPAISLTPDDSKFLRVPADGPLASGGAGGELPAFIGALQPGPAPAGGDWFSRLLARHLLALAQAPGNQQAAAGGAKRPRPLLDRDFRDRASAPFAREARSAAFDHFFENGRYVQVYKQDQPHGLATFPVLNFDQDIACEVVARAKGRETDGWGIFLIETDGKRRGVGVKLSRDGMVRMGGSYTNDSDFPGEPPAPVTHKAVKRGDEDNTLLVVLRDGKLSIHVNSVAVFPAIKLEPAFKPGRVLLSARPEWKDARVEFKHVTIWPAKDWTPVGSK